MSLQPPSNTLANRLTEVLLNGKWIANTNIHEQIKSISWQQAISKFNELNTIAALTYHVNYYLGGILNVFAGGSLEIRDKFSFDLPPIECDQDWQNLIRSYLDNASSFINHVRSMDKAKLEAVFVDPKYGTYRRNIEGVIEHAYYHLGQIVIIRKLIVEH